MGTATHTPAFETQLPRALPLSTRLRCRRRLRDATVRGANWRLCSQSGQKCKVQRKLQIKSAKKCKESYRPNKQCNAMQSESSQSRHPCAKKERKKERHASKHSQLNNSSFVPQPNHFLPFSLHVLCCVASSSTFREACRSANSALSDMTLPAWPWLWLAA